MVGAGELNNSPICSAGSNCVPPRTSEPAGRQTETTVGNSGSNESTYSLAAPPPQQSSPNSLSSVRPEMLETPATFVQLAVLEQDAISERWLETVQRHIGTIGCNSTNPICAIRAIVESYSEFALTYTNYGPVPRSRSPYTTYLRRPSQLLQQRQGDCRANSLLVGATLSHLGFRVAFVITSLHVIPAIVIDTASASTISSNWAIPLGDETSGAQISLIPIEPTFFGDDYSWSRAVSGGRRSLRDALQSSDSVIVELSGNVLYGTLPPPLYQLHHPPAPVRPADPCWDQFQTLDDIFGR